MNENLVNEELGTPESFYAKIVVNGGSKGVIIPYEILNANGWDTNTTLKVWVKKVQQGK